MGILFSIPFFGNSSRIVPIMEHPHASTLMTCRHSMEMDVVGREAALRPTYFQWRIGFLSEIHEKAGWIFVFRRSGSTRKDATPHDGHLPFPLLQPVRETIGRLIGNNKAGFSHHYIPGFGFRMRVSIIRKQGFRNPPIRPVNRTMPQP